MQSGPLTIKCRSKYAPDLLYGDIGSGNSVSFYDSSFDEAAARIPDLDRQVGIVLEKCDQITGLHRQIHCKCVSLSRRILCSTEAMPLHARPLCKYT